MQGEEAVVALRVLCLDATQACQRSEVATRPEARRSTVSVHHQDENADLNEFLRRDDTKYTERNKLAERQRRIQL
jgi:hypothetical protein